MRKEENKMSYVVDSKGIVHFMNRKEAISDRAKAVEADREYK